MDLFRSILVHFTYLFDNKLDLVLEGDLPINFLLLVSSDDEIFVLQTVGLFAVVRNQIGVLVDDICLLAEAGLFTDGSDVGEGF